MSMARTVAQKNKQRLKVRFHARLPHAQSTEEIVFDPIYGDFKFWVQGQDLIFLESSYIEPPVSDSKQYKLVNQARYDSFIAHTNRMGPCTAKPCYVELKTDVEGLIIFTHPKHLQLLRK